MRNSGNPRLVLTDNLIYELKVWHKFYANCIFMVLYGILMIILMFLSVSSIQQGTSAACLLRAGSGAALNFWLVKEAFVKAH